MLPVLMLFLIPVGGGIPAGVLLARDHHIAWPVTASLYLVSDVILAFLFEPVLRLLIAVVRRIPPLARAAEAVRLAMDRTAAQYGVGAGPFALVMIAFGVDPMTGRAAAAAAGHGFVAGWAIAITGDMLYFAVIMVATLRLNSVLGDPERTMAVILAAMFLLPVLVRRVKAACSKRLPLPGGGA
ncbi:MAG: hypothetical protein HY926_01805 [Elusimicrobia bacterium]|nr:hypothetical protein [Elusimicrobiota bacterium]